VNEAVEGKERGKEGGGTGEKRAEGQGKRGRRDREKRTPRYSVK
jgi:hypothetical protein